MSASQVASGALAAFVLCAAFTNAAPVESDPLGCDVAARLTSGWVCGVRRCDSAGEEYASFRGVPYAKQPLGELRFQELQPVEEWTDAFNATTEGPVCPQTDIVYKGIQTHAGGMSEACIHANVHVPLKALTQQPDQQNPTTTGLPIFVFVHGGGFAFGSGDTDLHGPEYLVSKGVIVITFNYRLNVFGFLSLNSRYVPGNNGLRDIVTLLRWVRDNAAAFGGNAADVTLAGQSAGAALAHLLTLSPAAEGLFQRVMLFSGVGNAEFFSTSPIYAKTVADLLLAKLAIPLTLDPEETHRRLVDAPLDALTKAHAEILDLMGLTAFSPVVESSHEGVKPILEEDPDDLIERGCGRDIPHVIGFTSAECETFRPRLIDFDIQTKISTVPVILVPPKLTFQTPPLGLTLLLRLVESRYFNKSRTLDDFIHYCSDAYYKYPALKLAEKRVSMGAPTYLHRFSYGGRRSPIKEALNLDFEGAGHIEDITYVFRVNSALGPLRTNELDEGDEDDQVKNRMTDYVVNFMRYGDPSGLSVESDPTASGPQLQIQELASPSTWDERHPPTPAQREILKFFDKLELISRASAQETALQTATVQKVAEAAKAAAPRDIASEKGQPLVNL